MGHRLVYAGEGDSCLVDLSMSCWGNALRSVQFVAGQKNTSPCSKDRRFLLSVAETVSMRQRHWVPGAVTLQSECCG